MDTHGYPVMWTPTADGAASTNVAKFMEKFEAGSSLTDHCMSNPTAGHYGSLGSRPYGCLSFRVLALQGDEGWQALRTGDPLRDFPLLQMSSFDSPETFWPPVLAELKIRFCRSPTRCFPLLMHRGTISSDDSSMCAARTIRFAALPSRANSALTWSRLPRILDGTGVNPDQVRWLPNATLNIAESCVIGRLEPNSRFMLNPLLPFLSSQGLLQVPLHPSKPCRCRKHH